MSNWELTTKYRTGRNLYRGVDIPPEVKVNWYRGAGDGQNVGQTWCRGIDRELISQGMTLWNEEEDDD